jgi:hypothetical protein
MAGFCQPFTIGDGGRTVAGTYHGMAGAWPAMFSGGNRFYQNNCDHFRNSPTYL